MNSEKNIMQQKDLLQTLCESCRKCSYSIKFPQTDTKDYLLCDNCLKNLKARSLLPIEWYHLISIYGKSGQLIDDGIYYPNGKSIRPKIKRELNNESQLPKLMDVRKNLIDLLEYIFFPYSDESSLEKINELKNFPIKEVINYVKILMDEKPTEHVYLYSFEIFHILNHKDFTDLLKEQWKNESVFRSFRDRQGLLFQALVKASLNYLAADELLKLASDKMNSRLCFGEVISYFPFELAIPWLEKNVKDSQFTWANFVVKLNITWEILEKWLNQGNPMDLVAAKTLGNLSLDPYKKEILFLDPNIKLHEPSSIDHMSQVIEQYKIKNPSKNVQSLIAYYNWDNILNMNSKYIPKNKTAAGKFEIKEIYKSFHIKKFIIDECDTHKLKTKFGGQPNWIKEPEWPIIKHLDKPMVFLGQIVIDKECFPHSQAEVAYLFQAFKFQPFLDDEKRKNDDFDYDFESEDQFFTVILQPGDNSKTSCKNISMGRSVSQESYSINAELVAEPDYIPSNALSANLSIKEQINYLIKITGNLIEIPKCPPNASADELEEALEELLGEISPGNKIGGIPYFIQHEEFPPDHEWNLLLQLSDPPSNSFNIEFGDSGTLYFFLSKDGKKAEGFLQSH